MYLVVGATGNVGSEVVDQLLAAGGPVRVFTRHAQRAARWAGRAELAVGDLLDGATVERAATGVTSVFVMVSGPSMRTMGAFADAVLKGGAPRVTFLSTLFAGEPKIRLEQWHADAETALRASGLPCTFLRPGAFMTNARQWADSIRKEGAVYNPIGAVQVAPIAPRDIARVAVEALRRPELTGQALRLTGPQLLSTAEQTAVLSRVLGKPLRCVDVPLQTAVDGMIRGGMPAPFADVMREMLEDILTGRESSRTDEVERLTGRPAQTFESWAQEHRAAFA